MDEGKSLLIALLGKDKGGGSHMMKSGEMMKDSKMSDGDKMMNSEGDEDNMGLEMAMEELTMAIKKNDAKAAAEAFKNALEMCDY